MHYVKYSDKLNKDEDIKPNALYNKDNESSQIFKL